MVLSLLRLCQNLTLISSANKNKKPPSTYDCNQALLKTDLGVNNEISFLHFLRVIKRVVPKTVLIFQQGKQFAAWFTHGKLKLYSACLMFVYNGWCESRAGIIYDEAVRKTFPNLPSVVLILKQTKREKLI